VSLFRRERAIEVAALSGTLRVTVAPKPAWIFLLVEGGGIFIFGFYAFRSWASLPSWNRALMIWIVVGAVIAWFYQLSGSEVVEFDSQKLTISKHILGWTRTSEYVLTRCRELEWRDASGEGDSSGLQCKVGWRTVKFAKYISEDEATEILTALQTNLLEVAMQLCAVPDSSKKHFTILNLS
jgi:hypothetical protein